MSGLMGLDMVTRMRRTEDASKTQVPIVLGPMMFFMSLMMLREGDQEDFHEM